MVGNTFCDLTFLFVSLHTLGNSIYFIVFIAVKLHLLRWLQRRHSFFQVLSDTLYWAKSLEFQFILKLSGINCRFEFPPKWLSDAELLILRWWFQNPHFFLLYTLTGRYGLVFHCHPFCNSHNTFFFRKSDSGGSYLWGFLWIQNYFSVVAEIFVTST